MVLCFDMHSSCIKKAALNIYTLNILGQQQMQLPRQTEKLGQAVCSSQSKFLCALP